MARAKTTVPVGTRGAVATLFPKTYKTWLITAGAAVTVGFLSRIAWRYRTELAVSAIFGYLFNQLTAWVGGWHTSAVVTAAVGIPVLILLVLPPAPASWHGWLSARPGWVSWVRYLFGVRPRALTYLARAAFSVPLWPGRKLTVRWGRPIVWAAGAFPRARTRRRVQAGMRELRLANTSGQLPRVRRVRSTAVGERVVLSCRPGHSAELLDARAEELRAAARSRDVRITRDPANSGRIWLDVVRRDPLASTELVLWEDLHTDVLSGWDPIHLGVDEAGASVRLSLVERGLMSAGEPGSGKSSGTQVIASHCAKSPDVEMVLIDPNRVQLGPWRTRASVFAADDPDAAVEAIDYVREQITRRLEYLERLPGVQRKLTREICEWEGIPLLYVFVDELAYHTSVISSQTGPFAKGSRDSVARGRAAGVIPVMATQRPTSDVVPTSLRDLFSMRCAFRCTTHASSDVILGEGWARRGYSAVDIDIRNRGVSLLLAEGQAPIRIKWAWIPDETIAELSVTTVRHRPDPSPALAGGVGADAPISPAGPPTVPEQRPRRTRRRNTTS